MRQPGWEGSLGESGHTYVYGWVPLLSTWSYHNIVNRLHSNISQKAKKDLVCLFINNMARASWSPGTSGQRTIGLAWMRETFLYVHIATYARSDSRSVCDNLAFSTLLLLDFVLCACIICPPAGSSSPSLQGLPSLSSALASHVSVSSLSWFAPFIVWSTPFHKGPLRKGMWKYTFNVSLKLKYGLSTMLCQYAVQQSENVYFLIFGVSVFGGFLRIHTLLIGWLDIEF